jgi:hypothetical protein
VRHGKGGGARPYCSSCSLYLEVLSRYVCERKQEGGRIKEKKKKRKNKKRKKRKNMENFKNLKISKK